VTGTLKMKFGVNRKMAFVLSGGGSRGALQVGALRALLESGYQPDLVTGTSIGSANAAFLAVHGYDLKGIEKLEGIWQATMHQGLLSPNLWWETMQILLRRRNGNSLQRIREFAIQSGLKPDLRFSDLESVYLYPVAADLNSGEPVVFGLDPQESVLDSVLASMTLPPWMIPQEKDGRYLMDGGAVSNLPIEAAMQQGATEIIALDLFNPREEDETASPGLRPFLWKMERTMENRQVELEIKLAEANGVVVKHIILISDPPVPMWDFRRSVDLMDQGYQITRQAMGSWLPIENPAWWSPSHVKTMMAGLVKILD
jgi:NTE family protein